MDIKIEPKLNIKHSLLISIIIFIITVTGILFWIEGAPTITRSQLWIEEVRLGDVKLTVNGRGVLNSKRRSQLVAQVGGMVESVVVFPGEEVKEGKAILLSNPAMKQELNSLENDFLILKAIQIESEVEIEKEKLKHFSERKILELDLKLLENKLESQKKLVQKGILAKLDFKHTQTLTEQTRYRLEVSIKGKELLEKIHNAKKQAANLRIEQITNKIDKKRKTYLA